MTSEKPLHVRVAEVFGWTHIHYRLGPCEWEHRCGDILLADPERMRWKGRSPDNPIVGPQANCDNVPRYDTDWSATGPLIEKHGIAFDHVWPGDLGNDGFLWIAYRSGDMRSQDPLDTDLQGDGATHLLAACHLLLALKEAGKLNP